ncbi:MAG: ABC transporter substrate-binding protein [Arachnia sp.]
MKPTLRKAAFALVATGIALPLALSGCSPSNNDAGPKNSQSTGGTTAGPAKEARTLRVWAGSQTPIVANFNPFAPTVLHAALGPIYEPLFFYNKTGADAPVGLLGDSFEYNADGTVITVKLKSGITWNDGKPFTADDVAFTFGYEGNKNDHFVSAKAVDETTVELTYDAPQYTNEFGILGATWMLPKHIWSEVKDFTTFTDEKPVGTGPYVVDSVTDASYTVVANEKFRTPGVPAIKTVQYIGIDANQSAQDLLAAGDLDWAGMFIPNPDAVTANGIISWVNTPQDPTVLYTCANADQGCKGEQTDVAVRQALNLAIDRASINEKAFVGLTGKISPAFTLMPRDEKWLADPANAESPQTADAAAAGAILEAAGYTKDAEGFYGKDGKAIELDLVSVDGWTDYNDAAKLISEQAAAAGIKVNASTVQWQEFSDARQTGNYELIMGGVIGTSVADPFQIYRDWFSGPYTAKVGTQLAPGHWNFSRYANPVVDKAVTEAAATNDEAAKKAAYATIQTEIVRDLPYIPLLINATQTFYNTRDFEGWPTEDNLYAFPPSWGSVASGYILQQIKQK